MLSERQHWQTEVPESYSLPKEWVVDGTVSPQLPCEMWSSQHSLPNPCSPQHSHSDPIPQSAAFQLITHSWCCCWCFWQGRHASHHPRSLGVPLEKLQNCRKRRKITMMGRHHHKIQPNHHCRDVQNLAPETQWAKVGNSWETLDGMTVGSCHSNCHCHTKKWDWCDLEKIHLNQCNWSHHLHKEKEKKSDSLLP